MFIQLLGFTRRIHRILHIIVLPPFLFVVGQFGFTLTNDKQKSSEVVFIRYLQLDLINLRIDLFSVFCFYFIDQLQLKDIFNSYIQTRHALNLLIIQYYLVHILVLMFILCTILLAHMILLRLDIVVFIRYFQLDPLNLRIVFQWCLGINSPISTNSQIF